MAVPETRQASGVPDRWRPGVDDALTAGGLVSSAGDAPESGLGGVELLYWGRACVRALEQSRGEIDALNVFPVPDSDTGRNLLATMRAAVAEAEAVSGNLVGGPGDTPGDGHGRTSAGGVGEASGVGAGGISAGGVAETHRDGAGGGAQGLVHGIAAAMARGATVGARGNSGIILSQVLRGFAEATAETAMTGRTYQDALARAAVLVRGSLSEPIEGTILTVLDRASAAAAGCPESGLDRVARAAAEGAARALDDTREQLAALRAAGVVDAGARGLLVLLDTMVAVVTGEIPVRPGYAAAAGAPGTGHRQSAAVPERYEVMFRITGGDDDHAAALRSRLALLGDSVVVAADGAGGWAAHVHCADAGAAVEAGLAAGSVRDIRIEYLAGTQPAVGAAGGTETAGPDRAGGCPVADPWTASGELGPAARSALGPAGAAELGSPAADVAGLGSLAAGAADRGEPMVGGADGRAAVGATVHRGGPMGAAADRSVSVVGGAGRGVLAVAAGAGAAALFEAAGAVVLTAETALESAVLLAAIREMPHREVLVLPNGALPAHELVAVGVAARDAHRDVLLLPSASMVQGLAAMAVHDRARIAVDDGFAMSEAAAATRWGALRRAGERALTMVGTCASGDGLGLVGHDVVVIDRDVLAAGHTLLDRMLGLGGELVTLLVGAGAPDELAAELARHIGDEFPGVEVTVYSGGQRADLIQIGVE
ncbi:DAK2 domain-containing protein [Nocardia sp. NPDC051750]|uniref:DAK2 domain-containing protein n=1 Tax=Nocardia sp. NPDC051750 TaxID=3364325 RepID=UPI0037B974BC